MGTSELGVDKAGYSEVCDILLLIAGMVDYQGSHLLLIDYPAAHEQRCL